MYLYENLGLGFAPSKLGFLSYMDTAGGLAMFPTFNPSGYLELGSEGNRRNTFMTYSALAGLTKIVGPHNFKFGFDGRVIRVNDNESK
ncbi:MAG TPA: hypothetical protein VK604_02695 [Bryobacteraceae bacterium]|nr:hypothetical protein [Bryobacteraceae bacterium]